VLTLTPQPGSKDTTSLVAAIVPDGEAAPTLKSPEGAKRLTATGNIAAASATTSDAIATPAGTLSLKAG
jgi:hypothetical protein